MQGRKIIIFLIIIGMSHIACAVNIVGSLNSTEVYMGESFELKVQVSSNKDESLPAPTAPRSNGGFKMTDSRSMTSMKIINGSVTKTQETTYEMEPTKTGTFVIYPGGINVGGARKEAALLKIKVSPQSKVRKETGALPFFVEAEFTSKTPYVGQQVAYLFKLYINQDYVRRISSLDLSIPEFIGFWKEQIKERKYYKTIDRKRYLVYEVPTILFPTRSGEYKIEEARINFIYSEPKKTGSRRRINNFGNSIFNDPFFSGMSYKRTRKSLVTKSAVLNVRELPSGIALPVGEFKIGFRVNKQRLAEHDAITAIVSLEGDGNINDFTEPFIKLPDDFKKFSSKSDVSKNFVGTRMQGKKTFEFAIVPEKKGNYKLGPVCFKYFDSKTGKAREIKSQVYDITVEKGDSEIVSMNIANGNAVTAVNNSTVESGENIKIKATEIRAIKGNQNSLKIHSDSEEILRNLYYHLVFWFCFPVFGFLYSKEVFKFGKSERQIAIKRSLKKAVSELNELKSGGKEDFKVMYSVIQKYFGDRFDISAADVTASNIVKTLKELEIDESISLKIADIMQEINFYSMSGLNDSGEFKTFITKLKESLKLLHSQKTVLDKEKIR